MSRIKEFIDTELNKVSNMNKEQKWDYFKSYYLAKTVCAVICLVLLLWFIKDTFFQKEIVSAGCVYGIDISEDEKLALTDGYIEYYRYNPKKYCAYVSTDNMFEGTEQQMDANAHEMALFAQIAAGEIYYLILDKENFDMMANGEIYASLNDLFIDGLPEGIKDCTVELTDSETGELYPAAVDLKKSGLLGANKDGYLVFTVGVRDKEFPKKFLAYLMNM